jgi:ATP-dependent DNA helicase DinG
MSIQDYITDGTPQDIIARYASLKDYADKADFGVLDDDVVVVDTEATGLSLHNDELIQIAAARMNYGEITEWFVKFVNPGRPIPEEVVGLTGIHDEDVADGLAPDDARRELIDFVGDSYLVAHNAAFDRGLLARGEAGAPLNDNLWVDSLDLARIALPRLKSHRLIDLVHAFDAPVSTHRADADVQATCVVYRILLAAVANMPTDLVSYIANMADRSEWPTVAVFQDIANQQQALEEAKRGPSLTARTYPFTLRGMRGDRIHIHRSPKGAGKGSGVAQSDGPTVGASTGGPTVGASAGSSSAGVSVDGRSAEASAGGSLAGEATGGHGNAGEATGGEAADDAPTRADANAAGPSPKAPDAPIEFPTQDEIDEAFSETGLVGSMYDGFEPRPEQRTMAQEVLRAISTSTNLVVEAGTGVGKSVAYLVPLSLTALRNNTTVGIATKTNALLDQLMYRELPLLAQALKDSGNGELAYAALKGFSHYPCLRKVQRLVEEGPHMVDIAGRQQSQAPSLAALLSYIEQTEYDDMDGLKLDYRALPRYAITTASRECLRRKCPFYGPYCYVHGLRKKAEGAHIVVTNHALFFRDIAADGFLLPKARFWVVDEAHGAENEARKALSTTVEAAEVLRLSRRLETDDPRRNPIERVKRRAPMDGESQPEASTLFYGLVGKADSCGRALAEAGEDYAVHMKDLARIPQDKRNKNYDKLDIWINADVRDNAHFKKLCGYAKAFCECAERFVTAANELVAFLEGVDGVADCQREIAVLSIDAKNMLQATELILGDPDERYVYAAHASRKSERVAESLEALVLDVGNELDETLYERTDSVVFASATISVGNTFDTFKHALGLGVTEQSRVIECQLGSSYDFDGQMRVLVVDDIPEPNSPSYLKVLQPFLVRAHIAMQGSMLTLFTNRREMEDCYDFANPILKNHDLRLVCQKWGVSVKGLRDDFLKDEHLSLFALKSFWEGFDAPGATLRGVIIPKLPFARPSDPLSREREYRDDRAWSHFVLPKAVIDVKQASGRLIRSSTDHGVLVLTDRRLITKNYGKVFLRSLPSQNITVCSSDEAIEILRESAREYDVSRGTREVG